MMIMIWQLITYFLDEAAEIKPERENWQSSLNIWTKNYLILKEQFTPQDFPSVIR